MNRRRVQLLLRLASATLLAASLYVAVWAFGPVDANVPAEGGASSSSVATQMNPKTDGLDVAPSLAAFEPLWDLDLQRPLRDAPLAKAAAPSPPPVSLAGTMIDQTSRVGVFLTSGGRQEIKGVGQVVEGVEVLSIRADGATVRYRGRTVELALPNGGAGS